MWPDELGDAAYLMAERLSLQAGVESPFWDEASLLMGGCDTPWYRKPLTSRALARFFKSHKCGWLRADYAVDDADRAGTESTYGEVMGLYGVGGNDGPVGRLYARRARSIAITVAFMSGTCPLPILGDIAGLPEDEAVHLIKRTWDADAVGYVYRLAFDAFHARLPQMVPSWDDLDEPVGAGDLAFHRCREDFIPSDSPEASPSPSTHGCAHGPTAHAMDDGCATGM